MILGSRRHLSLARFAEQIYRHDASSVLMPSSPARLLPQLADTAELVVFTKTLPGLRVAVLVPN